MFPQNSILITLPFPAKELSPNARKHWAIRARIGKTELTTAYCRALPYRGQVGKDYVPLSITFYPPNRRYFDTDNLHARMKHALDGVAKGLDINDKQFRPVMLDIGEPDKANPHVDVRIGGWRD